MIEVSIYYSVQSSCLVRKLFLFKKNQNEKNCNDFYFKRCEVVHAMYRIYSKAVMKSDSSHQNKELFFLFTYTKKTPVLTVNLVSQHFANCISNDENLYFYKPIPFTTQSATFLSLFGPLKD